MSRASIITIVSASIFFGFAGKYLGLSAGQSALSAFICGGIVGLYCGYKDYKEL